MFFANSRPDRKKRAEKLSGRQPILLEASPVPPPRPFALMTDQELFNGGNRTLIFDVETYPNYFLVSFKCHETGKVIYFERGPGIDFDHQKLLYVMYRFLLVGFNSKSYDLPMMLIAAQGAANYMLKEISDQIIVDGMRASEVEEKFKITSRLINNIDLIEVAPITASLKIYAGRLHCPRMQDLPYSPHVDLTYEQSRVVLGYNINDLDNTEILYNELKPQILLREKMGEEYGVDLRSKSDAQVAETVIQSELRKLGTVSRKPSIDVGGVFYYKPPEYLQFKTAQLQQLLEVVQKAEFVIDHNGRANTPEVIEELEIRIGNGVYRMGNGGLHSSEKSKTYVASNETLIIDRDVASYYPAIALNQQLYPHHLGEDFCKVYRNIVQRRLKAKKEKDKVTDQGLKITINGTFGKFANQYSNIYAPELLSQVTISGQLFLLMLIEAIELAAIPVISANTDGVVSLCPAHRHKDFEAVVIAWEEATGFITEETRYKSLHCRDVNNYIAVLEESKDGATCKTKGVYSERGSALNSVLSKNPESLIVSDAVQAFLSCGQPLAGTIYGCDDIRRFVSVRQVKGGAQKDGVYLGKAVRWYYAKGEQGTINYVISGNIVPKSEGAKPCMDLPETIPADLDYEKYYSLALETLYDLGFYKKAQNPKLFG